MSTTPIVQGWCPSSWQPMQAADGWVVRVRPPLALLSAAQALELARLAQQFGEPVLELSRRGNWQLRGVPEADFAAVLQALVAAGLASAHAQEDALPAVLCTPWYRPGDATHQLAQALQAAILARSGLAALPSKFGFAVDDAAGSLRDTPADIRLWHDGQHYWLHPDGLRMGESIACINSTDLDGIVEHAVALAQWFVREGQPQAETLVTDCQQRKPRARRMRHAAGQLFTDPAWGDVWQVFSAGRENAVVAVPLAQPGFVPGWGQVIAAPLGRVRAPALTQLAHWLAGRGSNIALHTTPWRMLLIPSDSRLTEADWQASGLSCEEHWITHADDARLRVFACSGQPQCPQALAPTQNLALKLADNVPPGWQLHVSGCAKACAQPAQPERTCTLVAQPGIDSLDDLGGPVASAHFAVQWPTAVAQHKPDRWILSASALCEQPRLLFDSLP